MSFKQFYELLRNTDAAINRMVKQGCKKENLVIFLPIELEGSFLVNNSDKETLLGVEVQYTNKLKGDQGIVSKRLDFTFEVPKCALPAKEDWLKYGGLN